MNRRYQFRFLSVVLTALFAFTNNTFAAKNGEVQSPHFDLILAGGGLATCSSFSQKNCRQADFSDDDFTQLLFRFSENNQQNFQQSSFYKNLSQADKLNIDAIIEYLNSRKGDLTVTKRQVSKTLNGSRFRDEYQELSDPLYYALFDFFEVRQTVRSGDRKRERVELSGNNNLGASRVYQAFYNSAAAIAAGKSKAKPHLIAITASSRDPFESADFYHSVFSNFDADVTWLPLDMSLQQAMANKDCKRLEYYRNKNLSFNRAAIYPNRTEMQRTLCQQPDELLAIISQADGIFFNGGDQSRTIAALTSTNGAPTPVLQKILEMNNNHQVVVGGTSAGTAVQAGGEFNNTPVVMLTNGDPEKALERGAFATLPPSARCDETGSCQNSERQPGDLTYRQRGGTGLFQLGLLDTHFSEREREVRLSVFAHKSGNAFGFGVDEATALGVRKLKNGDLKMQVIGENGVFISVTEGQPNQMSNMGQKRFVAGVAHFLNEGDKAVYKASQRALSFAFKADSKTVSKATKAPFYSREKGKWRAQISKHCGSRETIRWSLFDQKFMVKASDASQFAINDKQQCSYTHLPYVVSQ